MSVNPKIEVIVGRFHEDDLIPTGPKKLMASHGVDLLTGKTVVLPNEHPLDIGAYKTENGWFMN